jgi:hypothetical protein
MATKKIVVEKGEGVGEVVDRILGEPDLVLVLVVPKGALLGKSARNFHLIKREAAEAGKEIYVESVDENILAFAKNAGMTVGHPLLRERSAFGVSGISDIVPVTREDEKRKESREEAVREADESSRERKRAVASKRSAAHARPAGEEPSEESEAGKNEEYEKASADKDVEQEEQSFFKEENRFFKKRQIPIESDADGEQEEESEIPQRRVAIGRRMAWVAAAIIVLVAALYGVTVMFGSARIAITFKKTAWAYNATFTASKAVSQANAAENIIPAQIFTVPKNLTQLFPASGRQNVSQKAQGTITIYNAYSSSPQTLVATTRFVTPDGKIFRLVNSVIVPGAAVTNGAIVPSSINAAVVADQAGPAYNVSSTPKLTIPGLEGTPKYAAFYGSLPSSTSGGFVGEKAVPTADDITTAKQKVTDILTSDLQDSLTGSYTNDFKILDGATNIQITKMTVNTSTDADGNFSVFGEGTLSAVGFDESSSATSSLKYLFLSLAQSTETSFVFSDLALTYTSVTPDFANGKLTFSVGAQGSLEPAFSADDLSGSIAGKKISEAKEIISALPQLQEGSISVWPAWLWQIPASTKKIQVTVD